MLAAAFAGAMGWSWLQGKDYAEAMIQGAKLEAAVIAAVQQSRTDAQIATWKKLKEAVDEKSKLQDDLRKSQLAAADKRVLDALSKARTSSRLLRGEPTSTTGDQRVCADRDRLDLLVSTAINDVVRRDAERGFKGAEAGARAVDVAILCRDWTKALPQ